MEKKNILERSKALSSETRLNLIELIGRNEYTVSELKGEYDDRFDSKTRETVYRELEKLVDANLLDKNYQKSRKSFLYSVKEFEIRFNLVSSHE